MRSPEIEDTFTNHSSVNNRPSNSSPTTNSLTANSPIVSSLVEVRNRVLYCVLFIGCVFLGLFYFANDLYGLISAPLRQFLPASSSMIATDVASPFLTPFKLSFLAAIFISVPYIFYQIWCFAKPAIKKHKASTAAPLLVASVLLFYLGVFFAYFVAFPLVFGFLTQAAPSGVAVMTDIGSYLDFVIKLLFAFGIAFEIPVVAILLILTGITTREALAEKRPYVFIGCFVVGMLLTPPDILSQFLLALPMWLLFELGLLMSLLISKQDSTD